MLIILVAGQKGGVGKSTICWTLANAAHLRGKKVAILDADKQGSSLDYFDEVKKRYGDLDGTFEVKRVGVENEGKESLTILDEEVDAIIEDYEENGFEYLIIDTQGNHSENTRRFMAICDVVVIPVKPVKGIVKSIATTVELYEGVRDFLKAEQDVDLKCGLLLNDFKAGEKLNADEIRMMQEIMDHPLTLDYFVPTKKTFKNLSEGYLFAKELEGSKQLAKINAQNDADEAEAVLSAIEGLLK